MTKAALAGDVRTLPLRRKKGGGLAAVRADERAAAAIREQVDRVFALYIANPVNFSSARMNPTDRCSFVQSSSVSI
jgi:hypothetical protein